MLISKKTFVLLDQNPAANTRTFDDDKKGKKIIFLNHAEFWGGAEANIYEICRNLNHMGYEAWIVGPNDSALKRKCENSHISYYDIALPSLKSLIFLVIIFNFIREVRVLFKRINPGILISNSARCNLYSTIIFFFYPKCKQIWLLNEYQISKLHLFLFGWIPIHYIAVSEGIKKYYRKKNALVISNAFSLDNYKVNPGTRKHAHEQFLIGFFGRIVRLKGIDVLINAIKILESRIKDIRLNIYGSTSSKEPNYINELSDLLSSYNLSKRVLFCGFDKDVITAMQKCSVIICPTISKYGGPESFGRTIIEAMIAGVPVVASNCGGSKEIIEHNVTGLLVPENNPTALADAIERIYNDINLSEQLVRNALLRINKYDGSQIAKEYDGLFNNI